MGTGKPRRNTGLGKRPSKAQIIPHPSVAVGIIGADGDQVGTSQTDKTMGEGTEIGGGMATQSQTSGDGMGVSALSGLSRPATIMTQQQEEEIVGSSESGGEEEKSGTEKPSKKRKRTSTAAEKKKEKEEKFNEKLDDLICQLERNIVSAASFSRSYCKAKEEKDDNAAVQPLEHFETVKSIFNKTKTQMKALIKKRAIPVQTADRIGEIFKEFSEIKSKVKSYLYTSKFTVK